MCVRPGRGQGIPVMLQRVNLANIAVRVQILSMYAPQPGVAMYTVKAHVVKYIGASNFTAF
jgi:hypothetical protein